MVRKLEMSKVLKRVVLAQVTEDEVIGKYLNTADEELRKIEEKIEFPNNRRLKEINDLGIFDNSKRFSIEELTNQSPYYKLVDLFDIDYSASDTRLKSIDDINHLESETSFKPSLALYYYTENGEEFILITTLNVKKIIVKDKLFWKFKQRVGVNDGIDMIIHEISDSLELPMSNFICMISKKNNNTYSIRVYDAFKVDKHFQLSAHINKYAENVLNRFNTSDSNKLLLTADQVEVQIDDIASIMDIVTDNDALSKSLSFYSGHGNKTINQISSGKLLDAINSLRNHVSDEDNKYILEDIPKFENNKITVSGNQIKIFVALLNNQIVEKILNNQIELPYFD